MVKSLSKDMLSFHFDSMFLLDSIFLFDCVRTITHYIIHIANHYELWWIFFSAGYGNKLTDTSQMDPDVQKSYAHQKSLVVPSTVVKFSLPISLLSDIDSVPDLS